MNRHNTGMNNLKVKTMTLLLCSMILLLSACASTGAKIQTEEELLNYLSETYEQDTFLIKDSATQGNHKLVAFKDAEGKIGYALLEKVKGKTYSIVNTKTSGDTHLVSLYNGADGIQLLCIVNDGDAKKVVMHVDDKKQQSFELDKGSPAAYLFPIDYPKAQSLEFEFQNKAGKIVEK